MDIVNALAQEYAEKFSSPEDSLLQQVQAQTLAQHPHAKMLSGSLQGKLLECLSLMMCPSRILEIGSFTGYSALCLAKGLAPNGQLHTIELRTADAKTAKEHFNLSEAANKIILHQGDALEIIPRLQETWDMVFIDADKVNYIEYYKMVLPAVRKAGLIIADNVLFHGEVLEPAIKGKNAKAIQAFNEFVAADPSVEQVLLTVRDGLLLILKK